MDWTSTELIKVISFLLPGFLSAAVFYSLTAHPRKGPFERIVQALIFTTIIQGPNALVRWAGERAGWGWTADGAIVSLLTAPVVGLVFAWFANIDWPHRLLRRLRITKRTSHPSEWFSTFNFDKRYLILHLTGGRRLHGWPFEWPDQCDSGHFVMEEPKWILDNNECIPLYLVERILIPAAAVEMIEYMKNPETEVTATAEQVLAAETVLVKLHQKEDPNGEQRTTTIAKEPAVRPERDGQTNVKRVEAGHVAATPTQEKVNHHSRKRRR